MKLSETEKTVIYTIIAIIVGAALGSGIYFLVKTLKSSKVKKQTKKCDSKANCEGKTCGPNGCNGLCGPGCTSDQTCSSEGICVTKQTKKCDSKANCEGKTCGPNGCNGLCGPGCTSDQTCSSEGICISNKSSDSVSCTEDNNDMYKTGIKIKCCENTKQYLIRNNIGDSDCHYKCLSTPPPAEKLCS